VDNDPSVPVPPDVPAGTVRRLRKQAGRRRRLTGLHGRVVGATALSIVAAIGGGLALYGAFAPSTRWWLAIAGFALFGLALDGRSWKAGFGLGFLFGLAFFLPLLSFTNIYVGDFPWYALSVMEAL